MQCSRLCIISKIFCNCVNDDRSGVLVKTMKVTVRSLPKKNGVPVKINVILLRFPQANLFLAKNNRVGFHRCVCRRDRAPTSCYQSKN